MKTPHKHAMLIKAWADGAEIQIRWGDDKPWQNCTAPRWDADCEYRIKPEFKPDVIRHAIAELSLGNVYIYVPSSDNPNIKITFDGETGKLKSAEVL